MADDTQSPQSQVVAAAAPMFGTDGVVHLIPNEKVPDAMKSGGELAVPMRDPKNTVRYIRTSDVTKALQAGGKVDFSEVPQAQHDGFWKALGGDLWGMAKGAISNSPNPLIPVDPIQTAQDDIKRQSEGRSVAYRIAAPVAQATTGVNARGMEESANEGDTAGVMGHAVAPPAAAAIIKGASEVATAAKAAVPSMESAGTKFQQVMSTTKSVPLDISQPGDVALRIQQLADRGGSMPMVVRKFLRRITDPQQGPVTYEEGRDFYSNISRLSADEYNRLTPVVKQQVGALRVSLNDSLQKAAATQGKGATYGEAMSEYASAARLRQVLNDAGVYAWQQAKEKAPWLIGLYGMKRISDALK